MFSVAFEVLSARTPHPAEPVSAKQDGESASLFSDMIAELSNKGGPQGSSVDPLGLVSDGTNAKVELGIPASLPKVAGAAASVPKTADISVSLVKQADGVTTILDNGNSGQDSLQAPTDDCPEPPLPNDQPGTAVPNVKAEAGKQLTGGPDATVDSSSKSSTSIEKPTGPVEAEFLAVSENAKADLSSGEHEDSKVCKRATPHNEKSTKAPVSVDADDQPAVQTDSSGIPQAVATAVTPVTTAALTPDSNKTTTEDGAPVVSVSTSPTILAEKIGGQPSEKPDSGSNAKTQTPDTATAVADPQAEHTEPAADQISSELPLNVTAAAHIVGWRGRADHVPQLIADASSHANGNSAPAAADPSSTPATPADLTSPQGAGSGSQPTAEPSVERIERTGDTEPQKPALTRQDLSSPEAFVAAKSSGTPSLTDGTAALNGLPIASAVQPQDAGPAAPSAQTAPAALVPVAGIAVEIASKAVAGKNRFEIRLDPPELGRIHVRLDVDHSGEISSHLIVDRSDTLDLLRRDAPSLERALQDAGLKTTNNGLQFSLRDQGFGRHEQPAAFHSTTRVVVPDDNVAPEVTLVGYRPLARLRSGLDIRI